MSKDIKSDWGRVKEIWNRNSFFMDYSDFYTHPDADMLKVGVPGLTLTQEPTHFALWALMKSPLIIGADLWTLTTKQITILTNPYLIAFNQDNVYKKPAKPYKRGTNPDYTFNSSFPAEYWAGKSQQGVFAALFNVQDGVRDMTASFTEIPGLDESRYQVLDGWAGEDLGCFDDEIEVDVEGHDAAVLVVNPC